MKTTLIALALAAAALVGCASTAAVTGVTGVLATPIAVGASPEAQLQIGAQSVTAATVLANELLVNHKITVTQAKSYRNMLAAAGESLKDANSDLVACRASTTATAATTDPCWPRISDVVTIALTNIAGVRTTLQAK